MDINLLSQRFAVRRLDKRDVDMIYDMSCKTKFSINIILRL